MVCYIFLPGICCYTTTHIFICYVNIHCIILFVNISQKNVFLSVCVLNLLSHDSCGLNVQYIGSYICIHCLVTSVVGGNYWVKWRVFLFYSPGM